MQNRWALSGCASAVKPASPPSGDSLRPPPSPPDPPDSSPSLSPVQFPLLTATPPPTRSELRRAHLSPPITDTVMVQAEPQSLKTAVVPVTTTLTAQTVNTNSEIGSQATVPATGNPTQTVLTETETNQISVNEKSMENTNRLKLLPPNHNSHILTNHASNLPLNPSIETLPTNPPPPVSTTLEPPHSATLPSHPTPPLPTAQASTPPIPTLAEKLRVKGDRTLSRLAPVQLSETGRPRVLIPDSVFQEGANLHKDFIVCYFNGRPPPFKQIQSVLNHMWGKGRFLEMHNNPLQRSILVRIPSEFLRQKILDKNIWYVGESMFHTAQWSSAHSSATPPLRSIKIWAHLTGVPLDLRHQKGLSLVAGLIGEPKETDDFTLNLVNLSLSHVKVEVDLTKPLPNVVEFQRQSGEVVEVQVSYPWLPSTCSHCKELGHVVRNCLTFVPSPVDQVPPASGNIQKTKLKSQASQTPKKTSQEASKNKHYVPVKKSIHPVVVNSSQVNPSPALIPASVTTNATSLSLPSSPLAPTPLATVFSSDQNTNQKAHHSPSDKPLKPSLKRSRSSPVLSPPSHPKILYQSSSASQPPLFPEIGTLQYIQKSPFLDPSLSNPFLPLLSVDPLQVSGDPPLSS